MLNTGGLRLNLCRLHLVTFRHGHLRESREIIYNKLPAVEISPVSYIQHGHIGFSHWHESSDISDLFPVWAYVGLQQMCMMPACGLHWLLANNVYFDTPSNTVAVAEAWKSLVSVFGTRARANTLCMHFQRMRIQAWIDTVKPTPSLLFTSLCTSAEKTSGAEIQI